MSLELCTRNDLIRIFNKAHFTLRHYAKGFFPSHMTTLRCMPQNRLFLVLENPNGEENFLEDSFRKYPLKAGKLYFVPGFLPCRFQLDSHVYFLSLHVSVEILPGVEIFSGCSRILEVPAPEETAPLLEIFEDTQQETVCQNALRAGFLILSIAGSMLELYPPEEFWKPLSLHKYADLTDYLCREVTAQTSVTDLAIKKNLSRENFTRYFKKDCAITPKQLIDRFLTGRCTDLLEQGYSGKEIARKLKFRDEFAFSRYFKRNSGHSPRQWRICRVVLDQAKKQKGNFSPVSRNFPHPE